MEDAKELVFLILDACRVAEHDRGQVARGRRAVDGAFEALANKVNEVAAMIDVSVAEDDGIDSIGREGEIDVDTATALAETGRAAIQQDAFTAGLDEMHGAGNTLCSAEEGQGGI